MAKDKPAPAPPPKPILNAKQTSAHLAAFKRVAQLNLKTATDAQKQAAALDIASILQAVMIAWPLIVKLLQALGLPIPAQPPAAK